MSTSAGDSPRKSRFRCDGTFDIECADWDRFRLGVVYSPRDSVVSYEPDGFVDALLRRTGTYWAHAGGIYDLLLVSESLRRRGIKFHADLSQHRVTRLVVGSLTLRDSYALLPFPLDELSAMTDERAPTLPWACECGRDCGGYCRIPARCNTPYDPELEDYCRSDCRVLYKVIRRLEEHADEHGIDLRGTIGGTAWATAQKELDLPKADLPFEVWRRVRASDKGGRLAITKPRAAGPGVHFDIVNAYPGALARASVPVGRVRQLGDARARAALIRDRPGVYTVTVRVPEGAFTPALPWRFGGRVAYPTGEFSGTWTHPELIEAICRGAEITKVHHAVIWEARSGLFADLMRRWYGIRRAVGRSTPLGAWQSRLAKALTGKFAEQPERERIICHPDTIKVCLRKGRCRSVCTGRCGRYDQLDILGYVWASPYFKLAESGHAHWSAYLRALTRIQWLEAAERYKPGELCYGDTDSLWVTGNTTPFPIGDELGSWEAKHTWTDLEIKAPKAYRFVDGEGREITRGAPGLSVEDWRRGKAVIDRGVMTFRQAVGSSGSLFRRRHRQWTLPGHDRDTQWFGDRKLDPSTGITYPVSAREYRDHVKAGRATAA